MAGSWYHITDDEGRLRAPHQIVDMLDTGGDVVEALEQCYGMVQWLAEQIAVETNAARAEVIEDATARYKDGIRLGGGRPSL